MRRRIVSWPPVLLVVGLLVGATTAPAVVTHDCARSDADCTLAQTARQAHVDVGVAIAADQGSAKRALIAEHFTAVTTENAMKWGEVAPTLGNYDFSAADDLVDFATTNGLRLRGHALLWGRLQLPSDLASIVSGAADPAAELRDRIQEHFATMISRYAGRVALWDVVNEPLEINEAPPVDPDANIFFDTLGIDYIAEAFELARLLDPDAELFLNEFSLIVPSAKLSALRAMVQDLLAAGVPIGGIGLQSHVYPSIPLRDPVEIRELLRDLATLGLPLELTEIDVSIAHFLSEPDPEAAQAEYYGRLIAACMVVPACRAVTFWGLSDDESWLDSFPLWSASAPNRPLLFDGTLQPKPAYYAVRDAVRLRAVGFWRQADSLRLDARQALREGRLSGADVRRVARRLYRAKRSLRRQRFADGCLELAEAATALATTSGAALADLDGRLGALQADLQCP
jgi:endo-1,4-beta-xylanase